MDYSVVVFAVKTSKALVSFSFDSEKKANEFYSQILKAQWHLDIAVKLFNSNLNELLTETVILDNVQYSPHHENNGLR
jgi:hypothetical protein